MMTEYVACYQYILFVSQDTEVKAEFEKICKVDWRPVYVKNASAAVSILKSGLYPSLVIVDAEPRRDIAVKTIERLIKHLTGIPFVVIDSAIPKDYEVKYLMLGITDFIYKPFTLEIVGKRVERIVKSFDDTRYFEEELLSINTALKGERQRMMRLNFQLVSALSSTIDAKDRYTKGHSNRVAMYALAIAKAADCLKDDELETLVHAALLHDVGKIGVSDAIIRKPGSLTEAEYKIIKEHPVIGWQILKNETALPGISCVARWHHERYDGGDYPDGISRDAIPVMVRIVSIADSFDAMASDRSYRKAMDMDRILDELRFGSGLQFDPDLVDVTIPLIESGYLTNGSMSDYTGYICDRDNTVLL